MMYLGFGMLQNRAKIDKDVHDSVEKMRRQIENWALSDSAVQQARESNVADPPFAMLANETVRR